MFADYRVPQLLREEGVLVYTEALASQIDEERELQAGGEEESEIRAATIVAVERIKKHINKFLIGMQVSAIEVDWILWQQGENHKDDLPPHHKVLTTFY